MNLMLLVMLVSVALGLSGHRFVQREYLMAIVVASGMTFTYFFFQRFMT
jgi:hypothetical protein